MKFPRFTYMAWAKETQGKRGLHLTVSGVPHLRPEDLNLTDPPLSFKHTAPYGRTDLKEAVAARYGTEPSEVFLSAGSSMANYVLNAVLLGPGDEVVVESPAYEVLALLPTLFNAEVKRLHRTFDRAWTVDFDALEASITPKTRLVVLTSPHNPSGGMMSSHEMARIARLAEERDFWVLVDEVYIDLARPADIVSARKSGRRMLATNSMTKTFGLGGLRVGWALAPPELVADLDAFQDLLSVLNPEPVMDMACRVLTRAEDFLGPSREIVQANIATVDRWIAALEGISWHRPVCTPFGFPRLEGGRDAGELARRLEGEYGTHIVPGSLFDGWKDCFRIGFGISAERLAEGLTNIKKALGR
jgi:aspartate/methionine/tyrosine aminotransferase